VIQLPRSLARQLRTVFRRLAPKPSTLRPLVWFHAGDDGRRIRLNHADITAEFREPGQWPAETLAIPLQALADFEGRSDAVVTLEQLGSSILARWDDRGVPREMEYDWQHPSDLQTFPDVPESTTTNEPGFLKALADATQSAAQVAIRYAVNHLQLRGKAGEIVATDSRQLLIQSGFQFPWTEDVLIPASPVFGCREIPQDAAVSIGKTDTHVLLRAGPWSLFLAIDKEGRFPKVEDAIPAESAASARWRIHPDDAVFLDRILKPLPGGSDDDTSVTVDLNGHAMVRAKTVGQSRATEVTVAKSAVEGKPVCFHIKRANLSHALQLGLRDMIVVNADTPILCHDERRKFVFMPLAKEGAIPPSDNVLRVSTREETPSPEVSDPTPHRRISTVTTPETNGSTTPAPSNGSSTGSLIAEAEALRTMLHDAYLRSGKLVVAIKRQRKQAQAVRSTLAALKGLQHVEA
jgi:hypothetical protein